MIYTLKSIKINKKKLKYGSAAIAVTVIVIAIVVLINVIIALFSQRVNMSVDLTAEGIYDISEQTRDYLDTLSEPVEIVAMSDESVYQTADRYYKLAYEILKKYSLYSDNITLKFVNMVKDPTYVNKYSESYKGTITASGIVVSSGDNRIKVLNLVDLFNIELNYSNGSSNVTSSKAEQAITSAIMYVTDPEPLKALILDVVSVSASTDNIASLLTSNGFDVERIQPDIEAIPSDAALLVIDAPENDLSPELIDKIYDFTENGGLYGKHLIYVADLAQKVTPNIDAFLTEWGLSVGSGVIQDTNAQNYSPSNIYMLNTYIDKESTAGWSDNVAQPSLPVISYNSRPIYTLFENLGIVTTKPLLRTSETGYVFTDEMMELALQGEEIAPEPGNYNVIASSSKYDFDENSQIHYSYVLVFGSSAMLDSYLTQGTIYNNGDYFVSMLGNMTGKTKGVSIVAKNLQAELFNMNMQKYRFYNSLFSYVLPGAVLVAGLIVWILRRHK